jgi:hypothetical protein
VLCVESIGHPSVVMWGERGEIWCCGLSKVWNGGEGCDLHGLWLVMLKSAKDRVIGVDTPGQQVPPRVQYGTTCLLIRYAIGCVMIGWVGMVPIFVISLYDILCELSEPHGAKGATVCGKPQHCKRGHLSGNRSKAWHTPVVNLCNDIKWSLGRTPKEV